MTNPLRFKGEYFFTKEKLTEKLKEDLEDNGGENLPEADNVELYELYCQNLFERFGLSYDENKDRNEVLADISVLFEIGKVLRLNVSEYIGIESIEIPLLSGEIKRTSISTFSFISPALKKDFVNICDVESLKYPFSFEYKTLKTANQTVNPTLSFIENNKEVTVYKSSQEINLSNRQEDVIIFNIPIKDIIIHSSGVYLLSCNGSELCKISIPTIKLPLGEKGVQSFEQFLSYIDNELSGKPNEDLIFLYEFTKNRILELWLNDRGINITKQLDQWEVNKHEMTINDLNQVISLLGIKKKLVFYSQDYYDIAVTDVVSSGLFYKKFDSCFFKWDSSHDVDIIFNITPKDNINIDFCLNIRIANTLKRKINFNLKKIEEYDYSIKYSFNTREFSKNKVGRYFIEMYDDNNQIRVDYQFIITGERIPIDLHNGEKLLMIGICPESEYEAPFYIAETPITQKQLGSLINKCSEQDLSSILERSQINNGGNGELPVTNFSYSCCEKLVAILNSINQNFSFSIPTWLDLERALFDGLYSTEKNAKDYLKVKNKIQPVGKYPTRLGVCDLISNVLLQTSGEYGFWGNKKLLFGHTSYDEKNLLIKHTVEYQTSKFSEYEAITGLSIMMKIKDDDDDDDSLCRDNPNTEFYEYYNHLP